MSAISRTDLAIYLGIYASAISTATGLWALFHNIFRDRARVTVKVVEAYRVNVKHDPRWLIVRGEDTLDTMGVSTANRHPVLEVEVRNKGRRDVHIDTVSQWRLGGSFIFGDLRNQVPFDLPAERRKTLILGGEGGYAPGDIKPKRFYAVDGAGRIHPLRERWRQRLLRPIGAIVAPADSGRLVARSFHAADRWRRAARFAAAFAASAGSGGTAKLSRSTTGALTNIQAQPNLHQT